MDQKQFKIIHYVSYVYLLINSDNIMTITSITSFLSQFLKVLIRSCTSNKINFF